MSVTTLRHPSGREMQLDRAYALVQLAEHHSHADVAKKLHATPFTLADDAALHGGKRVRLNHGGRRFWLARRDGKELELSTETLASHGLHAQWIAPAYRLAGVDGLASLGAVDPHELALYAKPEPGSVRVGRESGVHVDLLATLERRLEAFGVIVDRKRTALPLVVARAKGDAREVVATLRDAIAGVAEVMPSIYPFLSPACAAVPPSETLYGQQRALPHLQMEQAWGVQAAVGDPSVWICVIDQAGVDLQHGDLARDQGSNAQLWAWTQATDQEGLTEAAPSNDPHGTAVAGIALANWQGGGMVGVAPHCSLYALQPPLGASTNDWALAIQKASGATPSIYQGATPMRKRVIVLTDAATIMSGSAMDGAITDAVQTRGCVVVVPVGNDDTPVANTPPGPPLYPATHPDVIAVGATTMAGSPGNELPLGDSAVLTDNSPAARTPGNSGSWASRVGPEVWVAAPGASMLSTDLRGAPGYAPGDYATNFGGTSFAAAHVAGVAALLFSNESTITPAQIKERLKRTADKVNLRDPNTNPTGYLYQPASPNVPDWRCDEVGFGRVNAASALAFADVFIADGPNDQGAEPSTDPAFWANGDVIVTQSDFSATDPALDTFFTNNHGSTGIPAQLPAYVYVRVQNRGPQPAKGVQVKLVLADCNTGFTYPHDWWVMASDADHVVPTSAIASVADIPANGRAYAKFSLDQAGLAAARAWGHACALAVVTSPNDSAFAQWDRIAHTLTSFGGAQPLRNDIVQRNLVILPANSPWRFKFKMGPASADLDDETELFVDARALRGGTPIRLVAGEPLRRHEAPNAAAPAVGKDASFVLLDRTRVEARAFGVDAVLDLAAGTRISVGGAATRPLVAIGGNVQGRTVDLPGRQGAVRIPRRAGDTIPMQLEIPVPPGFGAKDSADVDLVQRTKDGRVVGGIRLRLVK